MLQQEEAACELVAEFGAFVDSIQSEALYSYILQEHETPLHFPNSHELRPDQRL